MKSSTRCLAAVTVIWALSFWSLPALAQQATPLSHGPASSVGMDAALLDEAVQLYRDAVERDELKGAVLMVARRGVIVLHEAVGWRHEAYELPMENDTLFRMASNTKPVIGAAVLILQEEGRVSLDDRAARYLESFDNSRSRDITIRQLLSHSSGLRIGPIFYPFEGDENPTLVGAVAKFGAEGPAVEPRYLLQLQQRRLQHRRRHHRGRLRDAARGLPAHPHLRAARHDGHAESRGRDQAEPDGHGLSRPAPGLAGMSSSGRASRRAIRRTFRWFAPRAA